MDRLVEFIQLHYNMIFIIGNGLLFLVLIYLMYISIKGLGESKKINEISKKIILMSKKNEQLRLDEEKKRQILEGMSNEKSLMYKIDKKIIHSGIKDLSENITTEFVLLIILAVVLIFTTIGGVIFGIMGAGVGFLLSITICFGTISYLAKRRHELIESQLLTFMNLFDNYSKTSDDVMDILGKMHKFLKPPLSEVIDICYNEAFLTGDSDLALTNLTEKIGHEKFQEIIENIAIASKHEANYSAIINDERELVESYLNDVKAKKGIIKTARKEVLSICAISMVALSVLCSGFDFSFSDLYNGETLSSMIVIILTLITGIFTLKTLLFTR